ncbi:MAG TPA: amino acid-binding protein [Burkholderiales bacterium]|nr:amino acid-binding protein [Burkholderiales bacterium]
MALKATRTDMWTCMVDDRAGGTAERLDQLAKAGANLEMVFARRAPEMPDKGLMFVTPIKGAKAVRAAEAAGFHKAPGVISVRVEGGDKPGLCARMSRALGDAGISFRGLTAIAIGRKFISYIALDSDGDAAKAVSVLKKLG